MEIIYKLEEFPDPGDKDLLKGIQEINQNNYTNALKHFEKGATYDNEYATLFTAILYLSGFSSSERNPAKAMELFKIIASKWNNPVAQYFIGFMYFEGDKTIPQDKKLGFEWSLLSAKNGWSLSIAHVGYSYAYGEGVKEDHQKALEWIKKVVTKDDSESEEIKDEMLYLFGNKNFELNYSKVDKKILSTVLDFTRDNIISPIEVLSKEKNTFSKVQHVLFWDILTNKKSSAVAECQSLICGIYHNGKNNIARDPDRALYWARKSAKNGSGKSCTYIAMQYEKGIGVKQDYKEAMNWYKKAHKIGRQFVATFRLGGLYYRGKGTKRNCKEALHYFEIAASCGNNEYAYLLMGDIYEHGKDRVTQSFEKALVCYKKAFELGNCSGATAAGIVYCKSFKVKDHKKTALEWLKKGASFGCPTAPLILTFIQILGFEGAIKMISEAQIIGQDIFQ